MIAQARQVLTRLLERNQRSSHVCFEASYVVAFRSVGSQVRPVGRLTVSHLEMHEASGVM